MKNFYYLYSIFASFLILVNGYTPKLTKEDCIYFKQRETQRQSRIYEGQILEFIEQIRQQLKNEGLPNFGVPPLDPLNLDDKQIKFDIDNLLSFGLNTTVKSTGLMGFNVDKLKIGLIGLKFNFALTWPLITANGNYGLDANSPLTPIKIFGNGDFEATSFNLTLTGKGNLKTKFINGKMHVLLGKAEVDNSLEKFDFKISGVLDNDLVSNFVSESVSVAMPAIIKDFNKYINAAIGKIIDQLNDWIINKNIFGKSTRNNVFDQLCSNLE